MIESPRVLLVGMDYSPLGDAALFRALRFTEHAPHAVIHAVTVAEEKDGLIKLPDGSLLTPWAARDAVRIHLRERLRHWPHAGTPQLRLIAHVRGGDVAPTLVEMAQRTQADCLVLGAHSGPTKHFARLGSVAAQVLELAQVDVHIEAPLTQCVPTPEEFDPMRWAFIFGTGATNPSRFDASSEEFDATL